MHRKRVLTALVLVPLLVAGLLWGGETFFVAILLLVTFGCLLEYFQMALQREAFFFRAIGPLLGLIPLFLTIFERDKEAFLLFGIFLLLAASIILCVLTYRIQESPFEVLAFTVFGGTYIGLCSSLIYLIYKIPNGPKWIYFLFIVVFLADTGAYYVGTHLGSHKLCPWISKGKTVEGSTGGLFAGGLGAGTSEAGLGDHLCGWHMFHPITR